jgi:hypothetical protein
MSKVQFKEDTHQYFNTDTNQEYSSVSKLLGLYKNKFDTDAVSKRIAERDGITQEEVLAKWDDQREYACSRGTDFHAALEMNIKYGEVDPEYKKVIEAFQLCVSRNVSEISKIHSEILCYNDTYKLAGTADICWEHPDGTFTIGDFKTNKRFRFISNYKNWLKPPVHHLMECEFNTYTLQLSLYGFMYEIMTGQKCRGLLILYLDPKYGSWQPIRCNYMKHEVIALLSDYKRNKLKHTKLCISILNNSKDYSYTLLFVLFYGQFLYSFAR